MSKTPELIALVTEIAKAHSLNPALVCAVVDDESTWNTWAVRDEPSFFGRYVWPQFKAGAFGMTEADTRAMSFGLMQVMGEDAREFGFKGEFLTELCDPHFGVEFGCRVLAKKVSDHNGVLSAALLAYNGGKDTNYPVRVLALIPSYETPGEVKA